jgi:hypothetical protein
MATQWTAGLSDGTPLPAATLNTIGAAWQDWTPVVKQGTTTFGVTVQYGKYCQIQKTIIASCGLVIASGTGQAGSNVSVDLPTGLPMTNTNRVLGAAWIYDASANTSYGAFASVAGTTSFVFIGDWAAGGSWGGSPNIQMTTNDQIRLTITYETTA